MFSATPTQTALASEMPKTPSAAKPPLAPPPIQRQDSIRWYADNTCAPGSVKRQIPFGSEVVEVEAKRAKERKQMVQGACVELKYLFDSPVAGVERGTKGRVNKRIPGGWLLVKFVGAPASKVRTSNCTLGSWESVAKPPTLHDSLLKSVQEHSSSNHPTPIVLYARAMLPAIRACETLPVGWTAEDAVISTWACLTAAQREPWMQAAAAVSEWIDAKIA